MHKYFKFIWPGLPSTFAEDVTGVTTIQERATLAKQALANTVISDALIKIEYDLTLAWKNTPSDRQDLREGIWLKLDAMQKFKQTLNGFINHAVMEKHIKGEQDGSDIDA